MKRKVFIQRTLPGFGIMSLKGDCIKDGFDSYEEAKEAAIQEGFVVTKDNRRRKQFLRELGAIIGIFSAIGGVAFWMSDYHKLGVVLFLIGVYLYFNYISLGRVYDF